jgi:hypothetical protein
VFAEDREVARGGEDARPGQLRLRFFSLAVFPIVCLLDTLMVWESGGTSYSGTSASSPLEYMPTLTWDNRPVKHMETLLLPPTFLQRLVNRRWKLFRDHRMSPDSLRYWCGVLQEKAQIALRMDSCMPDSFLMIGGERIAMVHINIRRPIRFGKKVSPPWFSLVFPGSKALDKFSHCFEFYRC